MRKLVLIVAALAVLVLAVAWYPSYVVTPVKDGSGPLAIHMDPARAAPEYHSPLPWWQTHHMDVLNRGDLTEADCLYCHEPQTSCNNCHSYVGVKQIGQ